MSYLEFVISEHVLWIHVLQLSHGMAGNFFGPWLYDTSPQRMISTSCIK